MVDRFHKQITNARNSNEDFQLQDDEDNQKTILDASKPGKHKRTSALQLQKNILHGTATKRNFTTIVPRGLPEDLVGDVDAENEIERQNVLIEPEGMRHEAARLPPFKPFKTVSDEDNIHLLPGETGERARQNLLDAKQVTKKDVAQIEDAYLKSKKKYPWLYDDQIKPPSDFEEEAVRRLSQPEQRKPPAPPAPPAPPKLKPIDKNKNIVVPDSGSSSGSESESSESESESETEESGTVASNSWGGSDYATQYWQQYFQLLAMYYSGIPGGYRPCAQPYPGGYGPVGFPTPPCGDKAKLDKKTGKICCPEGVKPKKKTYRPKAQGLNFDFMPHEDLATEVTMTIEPDEPDALQYSVENGIMPIICCYMPNSLAVTQQGQGQKPPSTASSSSSSSSSSSESSSATDYAIVPASKTGSPTAIPSKIFEVKRDSFGEVISSNES